MRFPLPLLRSDAVRDTGFALVHIAALLALVHGARPVAMLVLAGVVLLVMLLVGVLGFALPFLLVRWEVKGELAYRGMRVPDVSAVRARVRRAVLVPLLGR